MQVRTVILIALLAIVRKLMILDLASTESLSFSRLRQPSWRLVQSTGSFETKIAASNTISQRNIASGDNRPLRVMSGQTAGSPNVREMKQPYRTSSTSH